MQDDLYGVYRAIVTSTKDPSNKGRVRVRVPQVAGNAELEWAESMNPALPVPAVSSIVWVMFNGGYINKPLYVPPTKDEAVVWRNITLPSGFSHNGNSNGNVQWTSYVIGGQRWVEWRGGMNVTQTGSAGSYTMPNGGLFYTQTDDTYIPPSRRSISTAQNYFGGTTPTIKIDFHNDGECSLVGSVSVQTQWVSLNNVRYTV